MKTYGQKYEKAIFFDWQYLYPAIRVIAVDFVYQGFGRQATGYGKPLHFSMADDFDWLIDYIEKTPGLKKYGGRSWTGRVSSIKKDDRG